RDARSWWRRSTAARATRRVSWPPTRGRATRSDGSRSVRWRRWSRTRGHGTRRTRMAMGLDLDAHPHAKAVLGAALRDEPAHAYLLHGPAGSGKRAAARAFAGELLARGAKDPDNARTRAQHGAHPDLTWVTPSGAHEMLRRDVDEAVVAAAAHT